MIVDFVWGCSLVPSMMILNHITIEPLRKTYHALTCWIFYSDIHVKWNGPCFCCGGEMMCHVRKYLSEIKHLKMKVRSVDCQQC